MLSKVLDEATRSRRILTLDSSQRYSLNIVLPNVHKEKSIELSTEGIHLDKEKEKLMNRHRDNGIERDRENLSTNTPHRKDTFVETREQLGKTDQLNRTKVDVKKKDEIRKPQTPLSSAIMSGFSGTFRQ